MSTNKYIAEAMGTFALVFAGCGAIVVNDQFDGVIGHTGVALVFGLIVMAMIYALGNISGAHINPAVTLGFVFAGRLPWREVPPYMLAQLVGAVLAGLLLRWFFPEHPTLGATLPAVDIPRAFMLEVVLSFLLMFVILNVSTGAKEQGIMAGVAVGGTVALAAIVGGPLTGASMNPARSIGPAVAAGQWSDLWMYAVAPVVGMALAYPTCRWVQGGDCCGKDEQELAHDN